MLLFLLACTGAPKGPDDTNNDADNDGSLASVDCDDQDAGVHPGADERCNGADDDCDGDVDEDAIDASSWYPDADGDSFGDPAAGTVSCVQPEGYIEDATDCDDGRPDVNPAAIEVCAEGDEDCDGLEGEADPSVDATVWYRDQDGDGFGPDDAVTLAQCEAPAGYAPFTGDCDDLDALANPDDCDDAEATAHPGGTELCDALGIDEDCDGAIDTDDPDAVGGPERWADGDGDRFGAGVSVASCWPIVGYVEVDGDCDDADGAVNPDASEVCDDADTDEDCDGAADDLDASVDPSGWTSRFRDADEDGFGDPTASVAACDVPLGYVENPADCDDTRAEANPLGDEICDGLSVDEDCDGLVDTDDDSATGGPDWFVDRDGDGYGTPDAPTIASCWEVSGRVTDEGDCDDGNSTTYPGAAELCNDVDDDCDAATSEDGTASFEAADGTWEDWSTVLSTDRTDPTSVVVDGAGALHLCAGTWSALFDVSADFDVDGRDGATIDGGYGGTLFDVDGADLSVTDVVLTGGAGDARLPSGLDAGGVLACTGGAEVTFSSVEMTDNAAELGGALAVDDCSVQVSDSTGDDNVASLGGAIYVVDGKVALDGVTWSASEADGGGGAYVGEGGALDMQDSLFDGSDAIEGGGLLLEGDGSASCSGSDGVYAGIVGTRGGSAVVIASRSDASFDALLCDLGTGADENLPADITAGSAGTWTYDDDATFTCDSDGCGDNSTTWAVGSESSENESAEIAVGNIVQATTNGVLDEFAMYMVVPSGCLFDWYVFSSDAAESGVWTLEWGDTGVVPASGTGWYASGPVGLSVTSGRFYVPMIGYTCSASATIYYETGTGGDAGWGTLKNYALDTETIESGSYAPRTTDTELTVSDWLDVTLYMSYTFSAG